MHEYLKASKVIDHNHPTIRSLASQLLAENDVLSTTSRCYHWVRDHIRHSIDFGDRRVTMLASDVLRHGTGLCYAKSHLLAALLRANSIPCGFVYQRLIDERSSTGFCLHGLNAVWLPQYGWYRVDPRGNRDGISTAFDPPKEYLAFATEQPGEYTTDRVFSEPLQVVVDTLSKYDDMVEVCDELPDWVESA